LIKKLIDLINLYPVIRPKLFVNRLLRFSPIGILVCICEMDFAVELIEGIKPDIAGIIDALMSECEIIVALRWIYCHLRWKSVKDGGKNCFWIFDVKIVVFEQFLDHLLVGVQL